MTLRVVFSRRHHIGTIILRGFLWSKWSHCAIIDGAEVIEAAAPDGVRARPLSALVNESSKFEIIDFPARDPQAIIDFARAQIGTPYDWSGVFGIGFRRRWQTDDAWFCSELIAAAFDQAGERLFRTDAWRITPRDLYLPMWNNATSAIISE